MMYEVIKPATNLEIGETYTPEEIGKKGDVNTMVRKGIIRAVGFLSAAAPMSDSEAARTIADLQDKLVKAEDERDESRGEVKRLTREVKSLLEGHKEGSRQLAELKNENANLRAELERIKAGAAKVA